MRGQIEESEQKLGRAGKVSEINQDELPRLRDQIKEMSRDKDRVVKKAQNRC